MKPFLPDVNVLIARAWPFHTHHEFAMRWYAKAKEAGTRSFQLVQLGFVCISANPKLRARAIHFEGGGHVATLDRGLRDLSGADPELGFLIEA